MAYSLKIRKVLITDEIDIQCVQILQDNGIEVDKKTKLPKDKLLTEILNYDGLIVRSATKVTKDVIEAGKRLKIIGRAGTGVDNIDVQEATKHGIIVMNTPDGNTRSAAELTCALICSLSRDIAEAVASLKAGRWDRKSFMGNELYGKTLAIIGLGRIGRDVAHRMQAFGMTTIGFDPLISAEESKQFDIEWLTLEQIWPLADYITVHTPLIPQTKNLINADVFAKTKPGVRVVNAARGGIVDEGALLAALEKGQCGGAALDVYTTEPPVDLELLKHPKVICTPHLGANTHEAQARVALQIAQQFVDAAAGKSLFGALNAQSLASTLDPSLQPVTTLALQLGKFTAALINDIKPQAIIDITTYGLNVKSANVSITTSAIQGLLQAGNTGSLNLINTPAFIKQLALQVTAKKETNSPLHYNPSLSLTVTNPGQPTVSVTGMIGSLGSLLVEVNGCTFASPVTLDGNLVIIHATEFEQILPAATSAVSNGSNNKLIAASISTSVDDKVWVILKTSKRATLTGLTQISDFATQLTF